MGLPEKRKIKELQETTFPGRVKDIEEICGAPIPYEVDWDSFSDDMEALRKIKLKNVKSRDQMSMTFGDGVLEMHCNYAQRTDGMYGDNEIRSLLEKNL